MRLNDNNTFIGINPPYQLMVIHSSKLIYPREIYQRGVERKRVELIARDFNEYIVNEPKVSFRNGRYYVMDGQHTIEGCILLNGGEDRPILCKVYTGLTMEQNGHAAPLSAGIKLRKPALRQRREPERDPGVAGTQRYQHHQQYLYPSGFFQQGLLCQCHRWHFPGEHKGVTCNKNKAVRNLKKSGLLAWCRWWGSPAH